MSIQEIVWDLMTNFLADFSVPVNYMNTLEKQFVNPEKNILGFDLDHPLNRYSEVDLARILAYAGNSAVFWGNHFNPGEPWIFNLQLVLEEGYSTMSMDNQFAACSYEQITMCVRDRLENVREYNKFRKYSSEFSKLRWTMMFWRLRQSEEIKYLLNRRRELKRDSREVEAILNFTLKMGRASL